MAFARLALFPDGTAEQHAALTAELGEDAQPEGRLFFAAGEAPGGWQTVQVWASFEALDTGAFRPALGRLGDRGFPEVPHVVDFEPVDLQRVPR